MEKIIISKLNDIIDDIRDIIKWLHPQTPNPNISFVGDTSDDE